MENTKFAANLVTNLPMEKLAHRLGGRKNRRLSRATRNKVQTSQGRVQDLMNPKLSYRVLRIPDDRGRLVTLEDGTRLKSLKLAKTLKNSSQIVCFVATVGRDIDREINKLMHENRLSQAYILDSMGSVAVEDMVDRFQKEMTDELERNGSTTTLRFSPGYCDWPVTDQKKLFKFLNTDEIGVRLSESCLMSPRKSISGVFGIVPIDSAHYNPCIDCRKLNCEARRS